MWLALSYKYLVIVHDVNNASWLEMRIYISALCSDAVWIQPLSSLPEQYPVYYYYHLGEMAVIKQL
jgi:hypothetical protein